MKEHGNLHLLRGGGEGGDETNPCNAHTAALIETIGETKAHQNCRSTSSSGGDNAAITK